MRLTIPDRLVFFCQSLFEFLALLGDRLLFAFDIVEVGTILCTRASAPLVVEIPLEVLNQLRVTLLLVANTFRTVFTEQQFQQRAEFLLRGFLILDRLLVFLGPQRLGRDAEFLEEVGPACTIAVGLALRKVGDR